MHPLVQAFEKKQIDELSKVIGPRNFSVGDTLKITVQVEEKAKKWQQTSEGVCISIAHKGIASSFVIRRLDQNIAIEMRFAFLSENVSVEVLRKGKVRRAKLYYLRHCSRKAGRIKELRPKARQQ